MKIVSIRPAKNLIASSVAGRPRGDPYEGPARAFFTGRELSEAVCGLRTAKVQVTSPALRATSPNMGGLGSLIGELAALLTERLLFTR